MCSLMYVSLLTISTSESPVEVLNNNRTEELQIVLVGPWDSEGCTREQNPAMMKVYFEFRCRMLGDRVPFEEIARTIFGPYSLIRLDSRLVHVFVSVLHKLPSTCRDRPWLH